METFAPERISRGALSDQVVQALRRAIIIGELEPGLHLEEPALAAKFGVSRIPVREALARLAHEHLIRLEPRRGAFVIGLTDQDVQDIYEFRLLLETAAIERASQRLDVERIAALQAAIDEMRAALLRGQLNLIAAPDVAFHQQIVLAGGNRRLRAAWEQNVGLIGSILEIADSTYRHMPSAVESHQAILDALVANQTGQVAQLLRDHLANGLAIMRQVVNQATWAAEDPALDKERVSG